MPPTPGLAITRRLRSTPWTTRIEDIGVVSYTVYNHMLLPTQIRGVEADYEHLRRAVQVWDVACERQVEVVGPDASRLAQLLTVRDLRAFEVGRCGYAPVVDADGRMINDPVALRVDTDRYWFSVADSDMVLWAGGIALGMGLDVRVHEPDVSPLAVQGPRSEELMVRVFGEAVRAIKFFRWEWLTYRGHRFPVARSGWSAQGGFEVYVDDQELGGALFDDLMSAGADLDVGSGCPNLIERIEAGLLTFGTDITREHTALEAGLERYCALDAPIDAIGLDALRRQRDAGLRRRIAGYTVAGDRVPHQRNPWPVMSGDRQVGVVSSSVWSPRLGTNVALGMLDTAHGDIGTQLVVDAPDGARAAVVAEVPFPGASQR